MWATDSERCEPINRKLTRKIHLDWKGMANLRGAQSENCGGELAIVRQGSGRPEAMPIGQSY